MDIVIALVIICCFSTVFGKQCKCGLENVDLRIVGGTLVEEGKYPWMAFINVTLDDDKTQCGGAIINNRYILTAAHCTYEATKLQVGVGSNYDASMNLDLLEVETYFHHPNYDPDNDHNDIALIKLAEPLTMSKTVRPVCLPHANMSTSGSLTVAGWGLTERRKPSTVLLETSVEEYDFDDCNYDWGYDLISSQFCAGLVGKDSCGGDSGGPLVKRSRGKSYVLGIVSYGVTDCGTARSAVYTKVTDFLDWIRDNAEDGVYCSN